MPAPTSSPLRKLHEQLAHWAATRPDHRALVAPGAVLTFAQLHARSNTLARQLAAFGVGPHDVVAFQLPNLPDAFALYHAISALDAVVLPLLPALREHDLGPMLQEAGAKLLVTLTSWRGVDHAALARRSCSAGTAVALIEPGGELRLAGRGERVVDPTDPAPALPAGTGLDAVSSMIFTSGTSGRPKAVLYSHRNLAFDGEAIARLDGLGADDVLLVPPAIAHVSGISFGLCLPMAAGCTVCVLPEWDPQAAVRTIAREGCTWTAGATPFLRGVVEAAEQDASGASRLRVFRSGGASVPPALVRRARQLGIDAYRSYGLSEHPTVSGRAGQDEAQCLHTDGQVHPHIEMIVVDPADPSRRLAPGETGELAVRGPDQSLGYLRPADNAASHFDGWLLTGDIGRLGTDRAVTITGRKKDIIIRKGENIAAKEIEDLVAELPAVKEVAVVGIPDADRGEMVCCVTVLHAGAGLTLSDLRAHLQAAGVATFKWPERLECVAALPHNPGGKVVKAQLRRQFAG